MATLKVMLDPALPDHPKVRKLAQLLYGKRKGARAHGWAAALGHLAALWCRVMARQESGKLRIMPGISRNFALQQVSDAGLWPGNPRTFVQALLKLRLLEAGADGSYLIHDWIEHQGDALAEREYERIRKAEYRERRARGCPANVPVSSHGTVPHVPPFPAIPGHPRPFPDIPGPATPDGDVAAGPLSASPPEDGRSEDIQRIVSALEDGAARTAALKLLAFWQSERGLKGRPLADAARALVNLRGTLAHEPAPFPADRVYRYALDQALAHRAMNIEYVETVIRNAITKVRDGTELK